MGGVDRKKKSTRGYKFEKKKGVQREACSWWPPLNSALRIDLKSGRRVVGLREGDRHTTQHWSCVCDLFVRCGRRLLRTKPSITAGRSESDLIVQRQCEQHKIH